METEEKKRKHLFKHRRYLENVAGAILTMYPNREVSKEIIFNTLLGVYETGFSEGYQLRIEDATYFKEKRAEHQLTSWNSIKDYIDDLIHDKGNSKIIDSPVINENKQSE